MAKTSPSAECDRTRSRAGSKPKKLDRQAARAEPAPDYLTSNTGSTSPKKINKNKKLKKNKKNEKQRKGNEEKKREWKGGREKYGQQRRCRGQRRNSV